MISEPYSSEDIAFLASYLAVAFFLLGLWLGWLLWGKGGLRGFRSSGLIGDPNLKSTVAPMLNPAGIPQAATAKIPPAQKREIVQPDVKQPDQTESKAPSTAESIATGTPAQSQAPEDGANAGNATIDDALGLIYPQSPEHADDLQAIKGVGKVLNDKLNGLGVYTYRQIAGWDDLIIAEFSTRLSFKDRIKRDDWVAQAKALHEEKYQEKLD